MPAGPASFRRAERGVNGGCGDVGWSGGGSGIGRGDVRRDENRRSGGPATAPGSGVSRRQGRQTRFGVAGSGRSPPNGRKISFDRGRAGHREGAAGGTAVPHSGQRPGVARRSPRRSVIPRLVEVPDAEPEREPQVQPRPKKQGQHRDNRKSSSPSHDTPIAPKPDGNDGATNLDDGIAGGEDAKGLLDHAVPGGNDRRHSPDDRTRHERWRKPGSRWGGGLVVERLHAVDHVAPSPAGPARSGARTDRGYTAGPVQCIGGYAARARSGSRVRRRRYRSLIHLYF